MKSSNRLISIGAVTCAASMCLLLCGCPFIPTPPPEAVLAGDWEGTTAEGGDLLLRFGENGQLVGFLAAGEGDNSVLVTPSNSQTTRVDSAVTVVITVDGLSTTYEATLGVNQDVMEGTVSTTVTIGDDVTVILPAGDLTLTRVGEDPCEGVECPEGQVCEDGVCVESPEQPRHQTLFAENLDDPNYQGTQTCLTCHADHAADIMETGHWNWAGSVNNIAGLEGQTHGKFDLINDY